MLRTREAAIQTRLAVCEKHGNREFPQLLFSNVAGKEIWVGSCDKCRAEDDILSRARQLVVEHKPELDRRVEAQMEGCQTQITEQAESEIEQYVSECREMAMDRRAEWESDVRRRMHEQLVSDVESEMIAEFVEQLRGGQ